VGKASKQLFKEVKIIMDTKEFTKIILENLLTLLIGGIPLVIFGYLLGMRQANINWEREKAQREKERAEEIQLLKDQL
jgi:uncharacterized protein (DUF2062 family)